MQRCFHHKFRLPINVDANYLEFVNTFHDICHIKSTKDKINQIADQTKENYSSTIRLTTAQSLHRFVYFSWKLRLRCLSLSCYFNSIWNRVEGERKARRKKQEECYQQKLSKWMQ